MAHGWCGSARPHPKPKERVGSKCAGVGLMDFGRVLDGVGDAGELDRRGPVDGWVTVLDSVEWGGRLNVVFLEVSGNVCWGLCRAEERVVVGSVANALAFESVLLSDKFWSRGASVWKSVVIQGRIGGVADHASNVEMDVLEFKGLCASIRHAGVTAFGRPQEPKECHNDKVNDVSIEGSTLRVVDVKGIDEATQDGDVGWASATGGVVILPEGLEERSK